jgi:hypothetical protein
VVGPSVCGEGAAIVVDPPRISVRVNGVAAVVPPRVRDRPVGLERMVTATVCGSRRSVCVSVSPPLSVAVSFSSRYRADATSGPELIWGFSD